ncbi:hypothetical protein [Citreimonas salinaria]|uniref:hypothetical protein n=1 Tax=Citreimonas salinaria TaxID=321339 RepID=UPI001C43369D|nr:hypothetical protein [Citreimonas salinaria]
MGKKTFPAPDLRDKLYRGVWRLMNSTLYRAIPTPFFGPRRALLRLFGARIAATAKPYPGARVWAPRNLVMEADSCIADGVICYNVALISIGANATVSQRAHLCTPSHDHRDPAFPLVAAEIRVCRNAWIAAEVFLGPGVEVGETAVVGARAVVFHTVPPNAVVAGNPARVVGLRYQPNA